jgi:hypothetical protein
VMGQEPFQGNVGKGSVPPEKDSLLSGGQNGMRTVCDRESDARSGRFRMAALCKKHDGEKTQPLDNRTGAMMQGAYENDGGPHCAS